MNDNGSARPQTLVTTAWVAAHLGNPDVRLIEVSDDTTAYDSGHIPGAVGWSWREDLPRRTLRNLPDQAAWEALLSRSGIGNDDRVVLYGDNFNWFAALAYGVFKLYGHDDVFLMDGGRARWLAEGRALTTERARVIPTTYVAQPPDLAERECRDRVAGLFTRPQPFNRPVRDGRPARALPDRVMPTP
jgi:thiosulfate/3-mercaptopyruvate sulfurtransferase